MKTPRSTKDVLTSHFAAVDSGDPARIAADYAADALLITPERTHRGRAAIEAYFRGFLDWAKENRVWDDFEMVRQEVEGEVTYIVWRAGATVAMATDTFIIRGGQIAVQTFSMH